MEFKKLIEQNSEKAWKMYIPHLSIDCVVFGFQDASLKVLTVRMKENSLWALPGGYVFKTENINEVYFPKQETSCDGYSH